MSEGVVAVPKRARRPRAHPTPPPARAGRLVPAREIQGRCCALHPSRFGARRVPGRTARHTGHPACDRGWRVRGCTAHWGVWGSTVMHANRGRAHNAGGAHSRFERRTAATATTALPYHQPMPTVPHRRCLAPGALQCRGGAHGREGGAQRVTGLAAAWLRTCALPRARPAPTAGGLAAFGTGT